MREQNSGANVLSCNIFFRQKSSVQTKELRFGSVWQERAAGGSSLVCTGLNAHTAALMWLELGEHCTDIAEVVGSNPVQSLNFFQVFVSVVLRQHSHLVSLFKTTTFTSLLDSII